MKNKVIKMEIFGIIFVLSMSVFLQNLFELTNRGLIGIMFGSVNTSIWEITKTVLLAYVIWSVLEMLSIKMAFRKFVAARTISICLLCVSYIAMCVFFDFLAVDMNSMEYYISAVICTALSAYVSHKLINSKLKMEALFCPALFLLLLMLAVFLSFTTFPPHMYIFMDKETGLYGVVPQNIDYGAIALDTFYGLHQ